MKTPLRLATLAFLMFGLAIAPGHVWSADPEPAERVDVDPQKLFAATKAKAEDGDPKAQFDLGLLDSQGQGIKKDDPLLA